MQLVLLGLAILAPRILIFILWLFTNWFVGVFRGQLWPFLGSLFFPYTLIWYSVVMNFFSRHWDAGTLIVLIVAIISDITFSLRGYWDVNPPGTPA